MNFTINEWQNEFNLLLSKIPTIRNLFGDAWLLAETQSFQEATRQEKCHPLVALIVNMGGDPSRAGYDADFIEQMFSCLAKKIPQSKISEIKTKYRNWHDFQSVFGELLIAYHLEKFNSTLLMEPPQVGSNKLPDIEWSVGKCKMGIEVNAVTETDGIRDDRTNYQSELSDAIILSKLVTSYRDSKKSGTALSAKVQARLNDVEYYDKIWEDPAPRVFGGVPAIRPRYTSPGATIGNLRIRKKDAAQVALYKYKVLGLILPDEYFPFPYSYLRLFDVVRRDDSDVIYRHSGVVHKSFYGLQGEPIFGYNHVDPDSKRAWAVREYDKMDGRFISPSNFDAAILCSIATSRGVITSPISYRFVLYEPFAQENRSRLLPFWTAMKLEKALEVDNDLSVKVCRFLGAGFLTSRCLIKFLRSLEKPKIILRKIS
ncbi:MAG TPA: hypothetical protein DIW27_10225 [Cytophagales bacterium]|nr:hypothetical protein [Cytophagales bacterium]